MCQLNFKNIKFDKADIDQQLDCILVPLTFKVSEGDKNMLNSEFIGGQNYFHSEFKGDKIMLNSEFIEGLKHFKQ